MTKPFGTTNLNKLRDRERTVELVRLQLVPGENELDDTLLLRENKVSVILGICRVGTGLVTWSSVKEHFDFKLTDSSVG